MPTKRAGASLTTPQKHEKVWGHELWIVNSKEYCGKILDIKEGWCSSYHMHRKKVETFHVLEGLVYLEYLGEAHMLGPGYTVTIKAGEFHRFAGLRHSLILEISTHHSDKDVVRYMPSHKCDRRELSLFWMLKQQTKGKYANRERTTSRGNHVR